YHHLDWGSYGVPIRRRRWIASAHRNRAGCTGVSSRREVRPCHETASAHQMIDVQALILLRIDIPVAAPGDHHAPEWIHGHSAILLLARGAIPSLDFITVQP